MTTKLLEALTLAEEAIEEGLATFSIPTTAKIAEALAAIREKKAELEKQEPVAVVEITYGREPECYVTGNIDDFPEGVFKLYASPVRTKDLTAQEKANIIYAADHRNPMAMIDAAIALYREKNK